MFLFWSSVYTVRGHVGTSRDINIPICFNLTFVRWVLYFLFPKCTTALCFWLPIFFYQAFNFISPKIYFEVPPGINNNNTDNIKTKLKITFVDIIQRTFVVIKYNLNHDSLIHKPKRHKKKPYLYFSFPFTKSHLIHPKKGKSICL